MVEVRKPPRDSIDKCTDRRYKKRNARVQKKVEALRMTSNRAVTNSEVIEYDPIPEPDAHGELHSEALAQAEREAAARPGVNGRLEDAIERIIAMSRVRDNSNFLESRRPDEHFEGQPAGNGRVWRRINDHWATGMQESISVFAPDSQEEIKPEPDWQEFPWEQLPDENIPPQPKRRAVIRHDNNDHPLPLTAASNCAGPSGWLPAEPTRNQPRRLQLGSCETSDEEGGDETFIADRREKRRRNCRAARQFIDTMATVDGGSKSDREEKEDTSSTALDDSFIVGDDIFD